VDRGTLDYLPTQAALLTDSGDSEKYYDASIRFVRRLVREGEYSAALVCLDRATEVVSGPKKEKHRAGIYLWKANIFRLWSDGERAEEFLRDAARLAAPESWEQAAVWQQQGTLQQSRGDHAAA
jgi:hypothetical protein